MGLPQNLAKKFAEVKPKMARGETLKRDGMYVLEVGKLFADEMKDGLTFVAEMKVIQATKTGNEEPHPAGQSVSFVRNMYKPYAEEAIQPFLCALEGKEDAELFNLSVEHNDYKSGERLNADQPARGMLIALNVVTKPRTKGAHVGEPFTYYNWKNVSQTDEEITARRSKI